MAKFVGAAAVYARISSDPEGLRAGVDRQVEDCRRLAAELGWAVGDVYIDNDVSAFRAKRRPAYERMLTDVAAGLRDAVLCYHPDRLTRRPIEFEGFIDTMERAGVSAVRFFTGGADLGTGDGLLIGRIMAAVAANESAAKSRRVKRKLDEVAAQGRPHGGFRRPFGYADDKVTVVESEAQVIREVVARYLAGESLRSLCTWLDASGVRTVSGGPWRSPTLRGLLTSGRIAGLREHRGEVVGPAVWPPIIDQATRDRVLARMTEQVSTGRRTPRRYLLSGLLRCGRCGGKLFASVRGTTRRYVCMAGPDHGGCGRLTVVAEPVEDLIARAVLHRLDGPALTAARDGRSDADERVATVSAELRAADNRLEELAVMYAKQEIGAREWRAAREAIERRRADAQSQLRAMTGTEALRGLGRGDSLREQWGALNLSRQAAIVQAVLDHARVQPSNGSRSEFDPSRVEPVWRL